MIRSIVAPLVALAFVLAPSASDARVSTAAQKKKLLGTWQLVSITKKGKVENVPATMKVTMTFKRGGTYALNMSMSGRTHAQAGTFFFKKGLLHLVRASGNKSANDVQKVTLRFGKKGRVLYMDKDDEIVKAVRVPPAKKKSAKTHNKKG